MTLKLTNGLVKVEKVSDTITCIELKDEGRLHGFKVSVFLVRMRGNENLLVDTGLNSTSRELIKILEDLVEGGLAGILITHAHPDHIGGAEEVQSRFGAPIYMHQLELTAIETLRKTLSEDMEEALLTYLGRELDHKVLEEIRNRFLTNAASIPKHIETFSGSYKEFDDWTIIHTPGHTPGHCCLLYGHDRTLIGGDLILADETSNIGYYPIAGYDPLRSYLRSLLLVEKKKPSIVLTSHGEPIVNVTERIDQIFLHHEKRLLEVLESMREASTIIEIARSVSWSKGRFDELNLLDKWLAVLEAISHVEFLRNVGIVESIEGPEIRYKSVGNVKSIKATLLKMRRESNV